MVDQAKKDRAEQAERPAKQQTRTTVTQTQTVEKPAPAKEEEQQPREPVTVTQFETAVSTVVVTSTVSVGNPLSPPVQNYPEPVEQGGGEQVPQQPAPAPNGDTEGAAENNGLAPAQFQQ